MLSVPYATHDAPATQLFFEDLRTHLFGVAVQRLVARSCYQDASLTAMTQPQIPDDEIALFFHIARLVFKTGPQQQHLLASVLTGFERRCGLSGFGIDSIVTTGLPLPTTHKAFACRSY